MRIRIIKAAHSETCIDIAYTLRRLKFLKTLIFNYNETKITPYSNMANGTKVFRHFLLLNTI